MNHSKILRFNFACHKGYFSSLHHWMFFYSPFNNPKEGFMIAVVFAQNSPHTVLYDNAMKNNAIAARCIV